ncbi:MAG: hypothetical protein U0670_04670 [Anaerolineae bacterium]
MASDQARDLRQRGIAAAKAGQKEEARTLLQQSIRIEPNSEAAWLWLASVARDAAERRFCLEKLLEINPNNETALKALGAAPADGGLRRIGEQKRKTSTGEIGAAQAAPQAAPAAQAATGIPIPSPEKIAEAQRQLDALIRDATAPLPQTVKYVHKTRRRAGEGDIVVYRAYLTAGIVGALVLILVIFGVIVTTNDDAAEIVFGPSATPSNTPTVTYTPTPGLTPTPSPEPSRSLTPSPEPPAGITPVDIFNLPRATPFVPPLLDRALENAVAALYRGSAAQALPTLEAARDQNASNNVPFDPVPYYYEALALVERGDSSRALDVLQEADERRDAETPGNRDYQAIIDSAYVQVYYALGTQASETGDTVRANDLFGQMEERANSAVDADESLVPPYLFAAKRYHAARQWDNALEIVNQGLQVPSLRGNALLLQEKTEIFYDQGELSSADYQAYLLLQVDPTNQVAHQVRINVALRENQPGEAVLRAQYYLAFYPGSRLGYQLLGDAHRANGDANLAIEAYTRGLADPDGSTATYNMYVARGDVYFAQRRYELARVDYADALSMQEDAEVRAKRMQAAYYAGSYQVAIRDAESLLTTPGAQTWQAQLFAGRALIADSPDNRNTLADALDYLDSAVSTAPTSARGTAYEYLARAQLGLGRPTDALASIDSALQAGDSPARRYIRGQILEAQNQDDAAILEYQWSLTLGEVVPFAERTDAERRLSALLG